MFPEALQGIYSWVQEGYFLKQSQKASLLKKSRSQRPREYFLKFNVLIVFIFIYVIKSEK